MLSNFTWWQFFGTFLLFCAFYYPFILWLYYKPNLQRFIQRYVDLDTARTEDQPSNTGTESVSTDIVTPESFPYPETGKLLSALEEDIQSGIKTAKDAKAEKAQLIGLLKNILLKYPELKQPGDQVKVNELLIQECGRAGYVLYQAEAYSLWPTTPNQPNQ